ncbi:hypothetical protein SAMN05443244_3755 [Terriglobus roseus]|uniref:Uncharacterized protein n=1 Tax=Terriglobus roseus TaxID=392734 RepID=A0A1H4THL0_9BACT|nr:hypothetical protein SAMN05443244_3755 [Terriglobus roseus]
MHDLLIAVCFLAMVISPAVVALRDTPDSTLEK